MRAAVYARVSTTRQGDVHMLHHLNSIELNTWINNRRRGPLYGCERRIQGARHHLRRELTRLTLAPRVDVPSNSSPPRFAADPPQPAQGQP